jgi:hypothetical protein
MHSTSIEIHQCIIEQAPQIAHRYEKNHHEQNRRTTIKDLSKVHSETPVKDPIHQNDVASQSHRQYAW